MKKNNMQLVNELIEKSKIRGLVLLTEILPLMSDESEEFEKLLERLALEKINVIFDEEHMDNSPQQTYDECLQKSDMLKEDEPQEYDDLKYEESQTYNQVNTYLKEISKYELLSYKQEVELASVVHNGLAAEKKLKAIKNKKLTNECTNEEIEQLEYDIDNGIQARDLLIESNLRLVVFVAKKYLGRGLDFQDLIQEGNLGLIKAAEKFDHTRGFRFSTYATYWIKQGITRAIADKGRTIRIPVHMLEAINKLMKEQRKLAQELRREPTDQELANKLKISISKLKEIQTYSQDTISLETSVGDDEESTFGDFVSDDKIDNPLEYTIKEKFKDEMNSILKTLSKKEEKIIRLRFGFGEEDKHTLEEIAKIYGVTRERIRQIEFKAMNKLRKAACIKKMNYLYSNI